MKHDYNFSGPAQPGPYRGIMGSSSKEISTAVAKNAFPLSAKSVVDRIPKGAKWVLIGEASHGTREFYDMRAGKQSEIIFIPRERNIASADCHLLLSLLAMQRSPNS